jgi:hypothetical protein
VTKGVLHVQRGVVRTLGQVETKAPKSAVNRRTVHLRRT